MRTSVNHLYLPKPQIKMKTMQTLFNSIALALSMFATGAAIAVTPGAFHQGTVKGMEDVLILNPLSKLVLAGANDSVLFSAAYAIQLTQMHNAMNGAVEPNKATGRHGAYDMSVDLTLHPFFADANVWGDPGAFNRAIKTYPEHLRCGVELEQASGRDVGELNYAPSACLTGWNQKTGNQPAIDPSHGYKLRIRAIAKMVQQVKEDVRRADKLGVAINLGDGKPFDFASGYGNIVKAGDSFAIPLTYFAGAEGNLQKHLRSRTEMSNDGQWTFCDSLPRYSKSSNGLTFDNSHLKPGDISQTCMVFKGLSGIKIPTALMVRDLNQFNPKKQRLGMVMVVIKPRVSTAQAKDDGTVIKGLEVTPIGWHVIDANEMTALTKSMVSASVPGAFATLSAKDCVYRHASHWGAIGLANVNEDLMNKANAACRIEVVEARMKKRGISVEEASQQIADEEIAR